MRISLCTAIVVWVLLSAGRASAADAVERPVLVLDFIGLNDSSAREHAVQFTQSVLPEGRIHTIGFRGVIPDAWRAKAGYDAIVPYASAADRERAVVTVEALANEPRTVLAFDFNESWLPEQLRGSMPAWLARSNVVMRLMHLLPNKIQEPAMVAAEVVARWRQRHPDGAVIVRTHSDGSWAALYLFDDLARRGIKLDALLLGSPRQGLDEWMARARSAPSTRMVLITAENDLWGADLWLARPPGTYPANVVRLHLQGSFDAMAAHGAVRDYLLQRTVVRTDPGGSAVYEGIPLGVAVAGELASVVSTKERHLLRAAARFDGSRPTPEALARFRDLAQTEIARKERSVVVWRQAAEDTQRVLKALEKVLSESPRVGADKINAVRLLTLISGLGVKIEKDLARSQHTVVTPLTSHTLEGLAELGLTLIEFSDRMGGGKARRYGGIPLWIDGIKGGKQLAAASGQVLGGQFEASTIKELVGGTEKVMRAALIENLRRTLASQGRDAATIARAAAELRRALLPLEAVGDLAGGIALHAAAGRMTLGAVDRYSDALLKLAAALGEAALLMTPYAAAAGVAPAVVVLVAAGVGVATRDSAFWSNLYTAFTPNARYGSLDSYMQYMASQARRGEHIVALDVYLPKAELRALSVGPEVIEQLNETARLKNLHSYIEAVQRGVSLNDAAAIIDPSNRLRPEEIARIRHEVSEDLRRRVAAPMRATNSPEVAVPRDEGAPAKAGRTTGSQALSSEETRSPAPTTAHDDAADWKARGEAVLERVRPPERAKRKPDPPGQLLAGPSRRSGPPGGDGDGPGGDDGKAARTNRDDRGPGGGGALKGVTVNPEPTYQLLIR